MRPNNQISLSRSVRLLQSGVRQWFAGCLYLTDGKTEDRIRPNRKRPPEGEPRTRFHRRSGAPGSSGAECARQTVLVASDAPDRRGGSAAISVGPDRIAAAVGAEFAAEDRVDPGALP